ncbi:EAL domain-containing protein [Terasakiella sp. A23]|uniref:EAL domain-containing protein n=1 Tax=Terasakiella sp. FCG-A23 TaxID=3080561 RepID=UPI002954CCA7|nr:EAL domain-containing protein [Terasakiella sp. A23]MDV7338727.1 EAL domain-containing protein [Terasakiella sp. A23]
MIFRFTPVVLFFFLGALISVGSFLLWTSYRNADNALQFEQLLLLEQTHELAEQHFNYRLRESQRMLEILASSKNGEDQLFSNDTLQDMAWDFVVTLKKPINEDPTVTNTYGFITDQIEVLLPLNKRWVLEETKRGPSLSYQFQTTYEENGSVKGVQIFKAGIYLKNNSPLLSEMRTASRANSHQLVLNKKSIGASTSLEPGVKKVNEQTLKSLSPVFSSDEHPYSGDARPLRIKNGPKELMLISVINSQGVESFGESFEDSILFGTQFVLFIGLVGTLIFRQITQRSLNNLLSFAKSVRSGERQVDYKAGAIEEFNDVGNVMTDMIDHLSEQAKYITDLVESTNTPTFAWNERDEITLYNKRAAEIFGDNATLLQIHAFFRKQNNLQVIQAIEQTKSGKNVSSLETILTISGRSKHIIWNMSALHDRSGRLIGGIAQGQDVTDRRLAERRLRLSTKVFDSTVEAIMITDDKGDIIDVNTAFSDITGYAREEVIGQNPRMMKSGRHSTEFYQNMWRDLNENGLWRGEIWDRRKNGDEFPKMLSISASRNESGRVTNYVAVFSDITSTKENEHKLEQLAHFDPLTGLPNRVLFQDRLYTSLARSKRDKEHMAVLFVDLDRFKQVNDSLGHRVGDLLLKEVSKRLQTSVREIDTVARLSGDEFTVILTDITSGEDIEIVASRIVKSVGAPYFFEGHELFISASVGIAVYPTDGDSSADLLRNADVAMYHAKEKGRNNYQFFDVAMNDQVQNQLSLANQLRMALNKNMITPHYQLKVDCSTGKPVGLEALARWTDDFGKQISPVEFIACAEENGLIVRLGTSIIRQTCVQARMWQDMQFDFGSVAINLSAQQFRDRNLINDIREAMSDNRVSPDLLEVEVTENMMMEDVEGAIQILNDLKEMGLKISIDDFGTGYSSLNYLKRFPVDTLKIDRSFVRDLKPGNDDAAIVSAIVSMAHELGIDIVAEGVENMEQVEFLKSIDCTIVQGFLYAKPCHGGKVPLMWTHVEDNFS